MTEAHARPLVLDRRPRPRILAACTILALLTCPTVALAGPPTASPADESSPTSEAHVQPAPTSAPSMAGSATAATKTTPPPRADDRLSLEGRALWDGLKEQRVTLDLKNGDEIAGRVVAQDERTVAFARVSDGMVVSVPKSEVAGVRVRPASLSSGGAPPGAVPFAARPHDSGRSLHAGGVAMLALGSPIALAGTVMLGICVSCAYIHLPLLLPGIGLIVGGSIALRRGNQREEAFRQAWGIPVASRMRLTPTLALGRGGGELGFTLRF